MTFIFEYSPEKISLKVPQENPSFLKRFLRPQPAASLDGLTRSDRALAFAIGDLKALAEESHAHLDITDSAIAMGHRLAGQLNSEAAQALGLPPLVDLTLKTDIEGAVGTASFRLHHEWLRNGVRQMPQRTGAILSTSQGLRRLPLWMMEALDVAENFTAGAGQESDWVALARFRQALDPGVAMGNDAHAARLSMTDFMQGLEVRLADSFAIAESANGADDFEIIPFSLKKMHEADGAGQSVEESAGELGPQALERFQKRVRTQGALSAYRVGDGSYLVIDESARSALDVMAQKQKAPPAQRREFIDNPRYFITQAVAKDLSAAGKLAGLDAVAQEDAVEAIAGPIFVETSEYSERVKGILVLAKTTERSFEEGATAWLPEIIPDAVAKILTRMDSHALAKVAQQISQALATGQTQVEIASGALITPTPAMQEAIEKRSTAQKTLEEMGDVGSIGEGGGRDSAEPKVQRQTVIVDTKDNFDELSWLPERQERPVFIGESLPSGVRTALRQHQLESFQHQIASWKSGLPGILNADEQGLGKTLQSIAFLRWLQENSASDSASGQMKGPILVVAPTSLLKNWEQEVQEHLDSAGLGALLSFYGTALADKKYASAKGVETDDGREALNLEQLHEAIRAGKGHRFWLLTTYTTLTNYQHSFAKIPFAAVVFDEIQALKNPKSLRTRAARAVNADYRIGLTGTPIENATVDLWAVMDQLTPGALGTMSAFNKRFSVPDEQNMLALYQQVFEPANRIPALAFRRLKEDVAKELPAKTRFIHPGLMPQDQATAYETARVKLAQGGAASKLTMLQHIRGVSVHPAMSMAGDDQSFINASARLVKCFEILQGIQEKGERALVFIEHLQMQFRFIALASQVFGLKHIDHINGGTPIDKRQKIVQRFQRHLAHDGGFDLLVLGPKAAGTGLTLTAATHVIHLSRWWNPAVEEQCNDRVHRIGQTKPVHIHLPLAIHANYQEHSFDCLLQSLMARKRKLAKAALWPMADCEEDVAQLQKGLSRGQTAPADGNIMEASILRMFERDGETDGQKMGDGSFRLA